MSFKVLICDHVGLAFDANGAPDPSEVKAHIEAKGGVFHLGLGAEAAPNKVNFYYTPDLSTRVHREKQSLHRLAALGAAALSEGRLREIGSPASPAKKSRQKHGVPC